MSRGEVITFKVNKQEKDYAEELSDRLGVSVSEAMRIILFDSRFLYSEGVDFGDVNVPAEDIIDESDSDTSVEDSRSRINGDV